ncbi:hypothetical protein OG413_42615 [Streptomyces sp. NBC_01433]|uniref:hypothetical protein n=1 Tax=Streptomyces sp. NBC_01433 TaxID=2903864 RepID=UPI00225450C5|nr:hypothetical protein [Streptomyces sp. NBC_01433]MCX4681896.1 hypothetical protein [Streptomyces sp. NBC_01433]
MNAPIGYGYCWAERPDTYARCTQPPGHTGPHYDWRAPSDHREWPNNQTTTPHRARRDDE